MTWQDLGSEEPLYRQADQGEQGDKAQASAGQVVVILSLQGRGIYQGHVEPRWPGAEDLKEADGKGMALIRGVKQCHLVPSGPPRPRLHRGSRSCFMPPLGY